jgi:Flp pilus assembly pilin Flp
MTFISGQKGNIAVEYGLIVGLWIAIAASLYIDVGGKTSISFNTLTDAMGITNTQS